MKLTKSTLKRLIREEHQKLLEEGFMDRFKKFPGFESAEEAGIDPKLAKEDFSEDEWALFSMFAHRWFDPDAQTGKIAWDEYDDGDKDILKAWVNWTKRAKKVKLEPSIYKMLVNRGWAMALRPKRARNVLSRRRKEDYYARTYPSIRLVSLTDEGREAFEELVDRATHLTKMEDDPDYRAKHRSAAEKAAGGLSIADDSAEGALSLT